MSEEIILHGRITNAYQLAEDACKTLSNAVYDAMKSDKHNLNKVLKELDQTVGSGNLNDDQKKVFSGHLKEMIQDRKIPLAPEIALEDFSIIDTNKNGQIQSCELKTYLETNRTTKGLVSEVALDVLSQEANRFNPAGDKCECDYPMASVDDIKKYERNTQAKLFEHNKFLIELTSSKAAFSQLANTQNEPAQLTRQRLEDDIEETQGKYCRLVEKLTSSNLDAAQEQVLQRQIDALDMRRQAEVFISEHFEELKDANDTITQEALLELKNRLVGPGK